MLCRCAEAGSLHNKPGRLLWQEARWRKAAVGQALAHTIASAVERAYRHGDLFKLMEERGEYCGRPSVEGDVVPLRQIRLRQKPRPARSTSGGAKPQRRRGRHHGQGTEWHVNAERGSNPGT